MREAVANERRFRVEDELSKACIQLGFVLSLARST